VIDTLATLLAIVVGYSPLIFFLLLFNRLRRSARKLHPRENGTGLDFFLVPGMRLLIRLVMALLLAFTALLLFAVSRQHGSWPALLIPLVVLTAISLAAPPSRSRRERRNSSGTLGEGRTSHCVG